VTERFSEHAFECLACGWEWRMSPGARGWPISCCPKCGGLYWEWLSYDTAPRDVYLRSEWLSGARRYMGTWKFS